DPRVGFRSLTTPQFSDNQQQVENISYIKRWRLEPKNASDATLQSTGTPIEPLKPIVFYIDPAFPKKWHPYIKEGVAEWQRAFEKAGWKNAIYALEWPENDSTLSLEDARYNVIRYVAADNDNVEGIYRVCDYRSGEFINTFIYFGAGALQDMRDTYVADCGAVDSDSHTAMFPDELMGALIRHRIARAVAPSIGLDNNLYASSLTPTDSLRSKTYIDKYSLAPSITDQLPYNFVAQPQDGLSRQQLIPRVSDGDEWTIEWGYKPLNFTDPEAERQYLTDLTTRHLADNPRHIFVARTALNDPQCKVNDLGDDQPKAIEYGLKNIKLIAPNLVEWGTTNRDLHYSSLNAQHYWAQINAKVLKYYVILSNNITGRCSRLKPASADGAVYFYNDKEYVDKCVKGLFDLFGEQPKWVWADSTQSFTWVTPERSGLGYAQLLAGSASVVMLHNLNQNIDPLEYAMKFYEFFFRNAKPNATPNLYERTLQSILLVTMIDYFNPKYDTYVNGDERPISLYVIKQIQNRLQNALPAASDQTTRDHYTILLRQIEEFLTVKQ
ncbi:MAG: zinc-dependent metalloprotease, partial [Bacteroidaceae bacterium]